MEKKHQFNFWYFVVALGIILILQSFLTSQRQVERVSYSEFIQQLQQGTISEVTVSKDSLRGTIKSPTGTTRYFVANRVDPDFAQQLAKYNVKVTGTQQDSLLRDILSWVIPVLFFFAIWMFVFRRIADRQGMGGLMNVGKSRARIYVERDTGVRFEDVAGADEAKFELQEIVSFLKNQDKFGRLGATIPKGILLVGPPGTGKTLMAKAVAGEASVPFFSISGSEFVELFVGVGAARVRDLFEQARKTAPCIIFIDELDALGKARSNVGYGGGNDEKEQTLNQLLAELDGFDPRQGIVLLAATNRPEVLDPALMRAGRFDRQVVMDRPDKSGRAAILQVHMKKVTVGEDAEPERIAAITPGFSGADLANLVNEAAIIATRRNGKNVTMADFTAAVERIVAGSERRSRLLNPRERRTVAYHEMGHALVAASLEGADPVHKVSIIPRSIGALGYTMQRPTEDRFLLPASELKDRMTVLLAGRAAEDLVIGEISTGAADDLAKVTDIARQIVTRFGMSKEVGQVVYERESSSFLGENVMAIKQRDYSEATGQKIDEAVRKLVDEAYERARDILAERRATLDEGAELLLDRETVTPEDFPALRKAAEARQNGDGRDANSRQGAEQGSQ